MRVALALPLAEERRLVDVAAFHGHEVVATCSDGDELAVRVAQLSVDLAIVAASPQHLTAGLIEACDLLGVRMRVVAADAEQRRHAQRLGIVDAVDGPVSWELVTDPAAPAASSGPASYAGAADAAAAAPVAPVPDTATASVERPTPRRGSVIAVWGPHGAPGRTSVAIGLAAEFAATGRRAVLADADTHAASVAPALGLLDEAPGFAAACRLAGVGGLDESQFERLAQPHRASRAAFRVLTGLGRPSRWPELGADRVAGVIEAARRHCDVLVVDVASSLEQDEELASDVAVPGRNSATLEVLRAADRVVAVAGADPVGIARFLHAHAELVGIVDPDRVTVAVNKLRSGAIGLNPGAQVRQTLERFGGIVDPVLVPWDPGAFDAAVLSGRALVDAAPRSAARGALRELAERLLPLPAGAANPRRRRRLA